MKVLSLLAGRSGTLVTREEIQRHVWGEETFVDFDQNLNWCIRRIREVLGDDASSPRYIQTVPRRGYRFVAAHIEDAPAPPERPRVRRRLFAIAAAVCVLALLLIAWLEARPARPTLLVLPFDDLGGGRDAGVLATRELIHSIARIDRIGVIDPLTAAKFAKKNECIVALGRELDAQYVFLGAVRRDGARLRLTAQLYRVTDNQQAWSGEAELASGADQLPALTRMASEVSNLIENS